MDCQIRRADGVAELVLVGSLDSSWSSYLSDRIDEVVRGGALEVRVDMAGVSYLSSNGIALLIRHHRQLQKIGGQFRIVADSEAVGHVLRLTGVVAYLSCRRDVAGARGRAGSREARRSSGRAWSFRSSRNPLVMGPSPWN